MNLKKDSMEYILKMTSEMHGQLKDHLFPGDNKEAIAFALCGRISTSNQLGLLVHKIFAIPHNICTRRGDFIEWPTEIIDDLIDEAASSNMGILKIHSHPTGRSYFSRLDDQSDQILFPSIYALMNIELPHYSAVMYDDGSIIARAVMADNTFVDVDKIKIVGETLIVYENSNLSEETDLDIRNSQTFGRRTTSMLKKLTVAVIGCSGTGSIAIEQLARLGIGKLIIADPDQVEFKNLNRILNSTFEDASKNINKVDIVERNIELIGFKTEVHGFPSGIQTDKNLLDAIIESDFLIGAVDSVEARHIMNNISTFYLLPYIDIGVKLVSDGKGGIDEISGSVHYLQPGKSSLLTRGVYHPKELEAENMKHQNPQMYEEQKKNGYIINIDVESPAVLPVNMQIASLAILEFLSRIHPYRYDSNSKFAQTHISISDWQIWSEKEGAADTYLKRHIGRGNITPRINMASIDKIWNY